MLQPQGEFCAKCGFSIPVGIRLKTTAAALQSSLFRHIHRQLCIEWQWQQLWPERPWGIILKALSEHRRHIFGIRGGTLLFFNPLG